MFIGREKELVVLENQYISNHFEFTVLYGRRRIGKTELLKQFIKDKEAIYYMAIEATHQTNLEMLSKAVLMNNSQSFASFKDYEQIFKYLTKHSLDKRLTFIIDEFPYLAQSTPEIASLIQRFCDHDWKETKLHLILCGSSMSFMEEQVLGIKSPLYGRRTAQIKLKPFNYFESEKFLKPMKKEDIAILHSVTGGIAEYLSYIDTKRDLEHNIIELFLKDSGRLYEEPINFLKQELREPKVYNSLLNAIANGASKNNTIATKVSMQTGSISKYINNLLELGIIKKETPILNTSTRKTIYRIADGTYRFWYIFVLPNLSAIELGLGKKVYTDIIYPKLNEFMGEAFEQIFLDYFDQLNSYSKLPELITSRGRWWGNNPKEKREEEIDCIGLGLSTTIFCEVKWTHKPIDLKVLENLIRKSELLNRFNPHYILFSKNGFTESLITQTKKHKNISLISFL